MKCLLSLPLCVFLFANLGSEASATDMPERVREAIQILESKQTSDRPIPQEILNKAKGIALIEITKGGIGVSGSLGEGIVLAKTTSGWSAPSAFNMGGGSVGFQIGVEVKKYIYVLNTDDALANFTQNGKAEWDAKASATAGPDHTNKETSTLTESAVYIYTSTDGAFAGAAVGGQSITTEHPINRKAYGTDISTQDIISGKTPKPEYAGKLYKLLSGAKN